MPTVMRLDPPSKRQKLDHGPHATHHAPRPSRIFAPFRTIGLVSPTPIPFASQPLGKSTFHITTSAGRCLQTYDLRRGLNLVFVSRPETPGPITAVATWSDKLFAAWSTGSTAEIWIFKRGKKVGQLLPPPDIQQDIVDISILGPWVVACCTTAIHVWQLETSGLYTTIWSPLGDSENAVLTGGIATLATFANKIFAGRADGSVEIWNISTSRLLYRILPPDSNAGAVSALQPTPALSLIAIAYSNGRLIIHNVRTDQQLLSFNASPSPDVPVTSISFRTDGLGAGSDGQQPGVMATASFGSGDISFWDLNDGGRRMATLRGAHDASASGEGISKIDFLAGQAVLVTSGADNSLKFWIFDHTPSSPIPRLLHSRSGHGAPVKNLAFLPIDADGTDFTGKWLLSTSEDQSMWGWSLRRDGQSSELSQGALQKKAKKMGLIGGSSGEQTKSSRSLKAPTVTCMACSLNRDGGMGAAPGEKIIWASAKHLKGKSTTVDPNLTGWESIVTGHAGDRVARTWFWGRRRAGRWSFETGDGAVVTSVSLSPCGTFAVIGSASGGIDMFNLQSGQHRQRFPPRLTSAQSKQMELDRARLSNDNANSNSSWSKGLGKHSDAVTGLEVDSLNTYVISCSSDGHIKFWDFLAGTLLHDLDWHASVSLLSMKLHRPSNLLILSCSDRCLRIVDIETRRVVRELWASDAPTKDYCFSNDGRWVVTSSEDAILRVWDLPTGHLIDAVRLRSPASALAFSDTGEFLALAQEDSVGIDLWTNKALFRYVSTQPLGESDIAQITSTTTSGEGGQHVLASALEEEQADSDAAIDEEGPLPNVEQLSREVETLSLVPRTKWHNLLHLEALRERNKPTEPPKAPEKAPFFLPSLPGDKNGRDVEQETQNREVTESRQEVSRIMKMDRSGTQSRFTSLLHALQAQPATGEAQTAFIENLKSLSPSQADIEIRSLDATSSQDELIVFVQALTRQLEQRRDYELVQAWMAVFLRCHGELVALIAEEDSGTRLILALNEWRSQQYKEAERLNTLAGYCSGVVGFMRSTR